MIVFGAGLTKSGDDGFVDFLFPTHRSISNLSVWESEVGVLNSTIHDLNVAWQLFDRFRPRSKYFWDKRERDENLGLEGGVEELRFGGEPSAVCGRGYLDGHRVFNGE